jgi:CRP/FNR family transcriptional regulator, cyclic AMP receptor protein
MTAQEALRQARLFSALPESTLHELLQACVRLKRSEGETLFYENEAGDTLFLLVRGRVAIERDFGGGSVQIAQRGPGECLGELTLLDGAARSATVVCLQDCELLQLGRSAFHACLRQSPELALGIVAVLSTRLREATQALAQTQVLDLKERLSAYLVAQSQRESSGHWVYRRTRDSEIARSIGAQRESVSRKLKEMHAQGWIERTTNTIVLKDREKLIQFAAGLEPLH